MAERVEFYVRRARPDDAGQVCEVHRASVTLLCAADYTPEQIDAWTSFTVEDFAERIAGGGLFLVADSDEGLAGFVSYRAGEIVSLYVAPPCARQGVATALLREVEVQARRHEQPELRLNSSISALGFYERRGYREVERVLYHLPCGTGIPCVKMVKRLGGY